MYVLLFCTYPNFIEHNDVADISFNYNIIVFINLICIFCLSSKVGYSNTMYMFNVCVKCYSFMLAMHYNLGHYLIGNSIRTQINNLAAIVNCVYCVVFILGILGSEQVFIIQ